MMNKRILCRSPFVINSTCHTNSATCLYMKRGTTLYTEVPVLWLEVLNFGVSKYTVTLSEMTRQ